MRKEFMIVVLVVLSACSAKSYEEQLKSYVDDPGNKITQTITVGDVQMVTKYLPSYYRELAGNNKNASGDQDGYCYFDVKLNTKKPEKPAKEKLLYLDFDMQKDFALLVNGHDSIAPAICQKIENGIAGCYEYDVAFEKSKNEEWKEFTLVYNDKIFSIGSVSFVFGNNELKKIPKLKEKVVQ